LSLAKNYKKEQNMGSKFILKRTKDGFLTIALTNIDRRLQSTLLSRSCAGAMQYLFKQYGGRGKNRFLYFARGHLNINGANPACVGHVPDKYCITPKRKSLRDYSKAGRAVWVTPKKLWALVDSQNVNEIELLLQGYPVVFAPVTIYQ
jgi:hypothetical protein